MRRTLAAAACLAVLLGGCKAKEAFDKAEISKDLQKRGTTDLMKEVADDKYDAPADNKLTEAQVQMYLKVREHEKKIAQVAKKEAEQHAEASKKAGDKSIAGMMEGFKTLGSVADMLTADIRAAKDLGYNTQEYLWVKEQILAASGAAMAEQMSHAMNASLDQAYDQARKALAEAKDEETKKMYAELVANYEKTRAESAQQAQVDPAVAHNRTLLKKYESELNAFASELAKFGNEEPKKQQ
jgi:hypothetical protein